MNTCNNPLTPIVITQGSDASFVVRLVASDTKDPIDLTSVSSCSAQFLNADGTFLTLNLVSGLTMISPATIGKILVTITAAQSALLQNGVNSFQITLVTSGVTSIIQFPSSINVMSSVFS